MSDLSDRQLLDDLRRGVIPSLEQRVASLEAIFADKIVAYEKKRAKEDALLQERIARKEARREADEKIALLRGKQAAAERTALAAAKTAEEAKKAIAEAMQDFGGQPEKAENQKTKKD